MVRLLRGRQVNLGQLGNFEMAVNLVMLASQMELVWEYSAVTALSVIALVYLFTLLHLESSRRNFKPPQHFDERTMEEQRRATPKISSRLPLRIAILECDTPLEKTKAKYGGYGGVFRQMLERSADALQYPGLSSKHGLELTYFNVEQHPELYPSLSDIDAILITGSRKPKFSRRSQASH